MINKIALLFPTILLLCCHSFAQDVKFYTEVPSYRIEFDSMVNEYYLKRQYRKIPVLDNVKTPGNELGLYYKHHSKGLIMVCAGGLISGLSVGIMNNNSTIKNTLPKAGIGLGLVLSLTGLGFMIEAPVHIKRASLLLNENGVGFKYNL